MSADRLALAAASDWAKGGGSSRRRGLTELTEGSLIALYAAAGGPTAGVALAAVGSLARNELGPRSDLDLVLLHDGKRQGQIEQLAEAIWYPLWDGSVRLDHSVRTPADCVDVAASELSAGVGLLDLRPVAGDRDLVITTRSNLLSAWRGQARKRLPELLESVRARHESYGDAAHLLEPDLKQARGGFRDQVMLRALAATWLTDRPHTGIAEPYEELLDVRDALQLSSGRPLDRLIAAELPEVAARLGYEDSDRLQRAVSFAARRIGHALDLTMRAASQALPERRTFVASFRARRRRRGPGPDYDRAGHGLIVHAGEVGLDRDTDPQTPLLDLHAAVLAARRGLLIAPITATQLGKSTPPPETPWSPEALASLIELLSSGPALLPVWEALDLAGCWTRWLPAWQRIRSAPQHNPIHRHTVDRHSVQCVVAAQPLLSQVDRPDLLLLACLLHDIGKGGGIESNPRHAAVGAPIAAKVVTELGLRSSDVTMVELLVREHLTLAELATKRDPEDPGTIAALLAAVGHSESTLQLLRCLTEADARATGSAAWSNWRAQLIDRLTERARSALHTYRSAHPLSGGEEQVRPSEPASADDRTR